VMAFCILPVRPDVFCLRAREIEVVNPIEH
jgi:hypothetical protein